MSKLTWFLSYIASAALIIGSLAVATPVHVHAQSMASPAPAAQPMSDQDVDQSGNPAPPTKRSLAIETRGMQKVEQRIKTLHSKLKITATEEADWQSVARTMRDNEAEIARLIDARRENASEMTAVDDLQSYQKITQAHADALQKMVAAFQSLYNDMSESQKKNADDVFGRFEGHPRGPKHAKQ